MFTNILLRMLSRAAHAGRFAKELTCDSVGASADVFTVHEVMHMHTYKHAPVLAAI